MEYQSNKKQKVNLLNKKGEIDIENIKKNISQLSDEEFISMCYVTILRRDADKEGLRFYTKRLDMGYDKLSIIMDILNSSESRQEVKNSIKIVNEEKRWKCFFKSILSSITTIKKFNRLENRIDRIYEKLEKQQQALFLINEIIEKRAIEGSKLIEYYQDTKNETKLNSNKTNKKINDNKTEELEQKKSDTKINISAIIAKITLEKFK